MAVVGYRLSHMGSSNAVRWLATSSSRRRGAGHYGSRSFVVSLRLACCGKVADLNRRLFSAGIVPFSIGLTGCGERARQDLGEFPGIGLSLGEFHELYGEPASVELPKFNSTSTITANLYDFGDFVVRHTYPLKNQNSTILLLVCVPEESTNREGILKIAERLLPVDATYVKSVSLQDDILTGVTMVYESPLFLEKFQTKRALFDPEFLLVNCISESSQFGLFRAAEVTVRMESL